MNKTLTLTVVVMVLLIFHCALSFVSNDAYIKGDYFSSGIIIDSQGKVLESSERQYFNEDSVYSYEMLGDQIYTSNMKRRQSFFGYVYYIVSDGVSGKRMLDTPLDRDIYFNKSYSTRVGSLITMNIIHYPEKSKFLCFYIDELDEAKCYGLHIP